MLRNVNVLRHRSEKCQIKKLSANYLGIIFKIIKGTAELGRNSYGFEIEKDFYENALEKMLNKNDIWELSQMTIDNFN